MALWFRSRMVNPDPAFPDSADDELLVAAARHDPAAFALLYQRYLQPIYRYCYVRLGSHEAAEDATSDVFLKALAALEGFRGGLFAAWLFRIAHNVVTDQYRARRPTTPIEQADGHVDAEHSPEELALARSERDGLQAVLQQLPEEQRRVLELQLAGWSGEQIAAALGRSHGAIRMLRLRAVQQLKTLLTTDELASGGGRRR